MILPREVLSVAAFGQKRVDIMVAMKEILFGTTNPAKVKQLQGALAPIGIAVRGVGDASQLPPVEEDGRTAQENAFKKAMAYAGALRVPVLAMDNALYLDGLPLEEQPGIHVRRINGSTTIRPSDEELLAHYVALVRRYGKTMTGRWEFAICIATPKRECTETTIVSPRIFTSVPSPKTVVGYPLEAMQIDPATGKYISEMSQEEQDQFWQRAIGKPLQEFIKRIQF
jgi:8-oxo-dGTP diphosphatase